MTDRPSSIRVANRGLRVPFTVGAGLAVGAVWGLADLPPLNAEIGKGALEVLVGLGVVVVVSRLMGHSQEQPYVEFGGSGIAFGRRQHLPWEAVEAVHVSGSGAKRIRIELVPTRDWRPRGIARFAWGWRRWPIRLSRFDRRMSAEEWMGIVGAFAPFTLPVIERPHGSR